MKDGFVSVANATPNLRLADCAYNAEQTFTLMRQAEKSGVTFIVFPELNLTGYTCGDLFYQDTLLRGAEDALETVLQATRPLNVVAAVGLPVRNNNKLYNCCAIIQSGNILGVIPKQHLPNYSEFYEKRQFAPGTAEVEICTLCGQKTPFGGNLLFSCKEMPDLKIGVEICEDLWAYDAPSIELARAGATIIGNLSASNDIIGKDSYRRQLVMMQSAKLLCGYVYTSAGEGESSSDLVFGAHAIIAENGALLAQRRFETGLQISEIDVQKLVGERRRTQAFGDAPKVKMEEIEFSSPLEETPLTRYVAPHPFVPEDKEDRDARCQEILLLTALGLKRRMEHTGSKTAVVGLSGGLDSTLAVLIIGLAFRMMDKSPADIIAVTMPCFGTTKRTKNNAVILAGKLGATLRTVDISASVRQHFADIGHDINDHSVTYENGQARERTQVLMDLANQTRGLVIGTGDLSELALGWCTYNGDHMSNYAVNTSIPKTLVRHLVAYVARDNAKKDADLQNVLEDILDTPVSPELLPAVQGKISQRTEDLVGPYELHDFFMYYILRWGFAPRKVFRLAEYALGDVYSRDVILKWLKMFYRRFFSQQFKRNCLPDGPKIGSVSVSPRGDLRMPSDAVAALWKAEAEAIRA